MAKKHLSYDDYELDVDMDCFDDVEFFEIVDKLEEQPKLNIDLLKMAIGENGYKSFADYFKKRDGKLKMSTVMSAVAKIFEESDPKGSASGELEKTTQKS